MQLQKELLITQQNLYKIICIIGVEKLLKINARI